MSTGSVQTYMVEAYNLSHASENKIHDDAVARKLGFTGGLVPGVEVYAYATNLAVQRWGLDWLTRGRMEARFLKPVYDGRMAQVTATPAGDTLDLKVESEGVLGATGTASLGPATTPPRVSEFAVRALPAERPPADQASLVEGSWLTSRPVPVTPALAADYLRDIREAEPIYADRTIVHPGLLLRQCNMALRDNVVLPPWIHTGSKVWNFAAGRVGDTLTVRAKVTANYERKGHRLVDLDCLVVADGGRVLAQVLHTAVYQLRQLAAA